MRRIAQTCLASLLLLGGLATAYAQDPFTARPALRAWKANRFDVLNHVLDGVANKTLEYSQRVAGERYVYDHRVPIAERILGRNAAAANATEGADWATNYFQHYARQLRVVRSSPDALLSFLRDSALRWGDKETLGFSAFQLHRMHHALYRDLVMLLQQHDDIYVRRGPAYATSVPMTPEFRRELEVTHSALSAERERPSKR